MPKDSLNYIFERFYRVDESRSKETGGIGVGLTIVKSIVDLHKGKIEVKSKVKEGSEFIITLPIIKK
ncbi:ATP-binding protein [Paraclostridium sp. AKS81]|uniref:ATP-binding protein n=1 Tax=Paraclostridium sp. AKS81 TaxID=2876117 RepID=UPI003FA71018